jgi:hypothetical protein
MTEGQWFYHLGLRKQQLGDEAGARRTWQALVTAFGDVASEQAWVDLAKRELTGNSSETLWRELGPVHEAQQRGQELQQSGQAAGERILKALKELYGADKPALQPTAKQK